MSIKELEERINNFERRLEAFERGSYGIDEHQSKQLFAEFDIIKKKMEAIETMESEVEAITAHVKNVNRDIYGINPDGSKKDEGIITLVRVFIEKVEGQFNLGKLQFKTLNLYAKVILGFMVVNVGLNVYKEVKEPNVIQPTYYQAKQTQEAPQTPPPVFNSPNKEAIIPRNETDTKKHGN